LRPQNGNWKRKPEAAIEMATEAAIENGCRMWQRLHGGKGCATAKEKSQKLFFIPSLFEGPL
jgi:hypothetical protein